eukprot:NODE_198_length_15297_cov_0.486182.p10 type:complete len:209 gc:universal NODE_198_length_15297_cov_0.486182:13967-13341(-)
MSELEKSTQIKKEVDSKSRFYLKLPKMITNLQTLPISEGAFRINLRKSRLDELIAKQELSPRTEELCCVIKDLLSTTINIAMVYEFDIVTSDKKLKFLTSDITHEEGYKLLQACVLLNTLIKTGLIENTRLSEDSLLDILIPRLFEIRYEQIYSDIYYCKKIFQFLLDIKLPTPTGSRSVLATASPPKKKPFQRPIIQQTHRLQAKKP